MTAAGIGVVREEEIRSQALDLKVHDHLLNHDEVIELWMRSRYGDAFTHPLWYEACVNNLRESERVCSLRVFAIYAGRSLVAYWPFWLRRGKAKDLWAWVAEPVGVWMSDYAAPLFCRDYDSASILSLIAASVVNLVQDGCLVLLPKVPADLYLQNYLTGSIGLVMQCRQSPCLRFWGNFEVTESHWKKSHRGDVRRQRRKFEELGGIELVCMTDPQLIRARLPILFDLHIREWGGKNDPSQFNRDHIRSLFIDIAGVKDAVHYSEIRIKTTGDVVSAHLGFLCNGWLYWYKPTYNAVYQKLSPSKVHLALLTRYGIGQGWQGIDFLQGEEVYKSLWSNESKESIWLTLGRSANDPRLRWREKYRAHVRAIYLDWKKRLAIRL